MEKFVTVEQCRVYYLLSFAHQIELNLQKELFIITPFIVELILTVKASVKFC